MIAGGGFAVADVIVACSFAEGCMILRGGVAGVIVDYDVSARRPGGQAGK